MSRERRQGHCSVLCWVGLPCSALQGQQAAAAPPACCFPGPASARLLIASCTAPAPPPPLPHCSSKDVIEPVLKPQWWVNCQDMAAQACDVVRDGRLEIIPREFEGTWFR